MTEMTRGDDARQLVRDIALHLSTKATGIRTEQRMTNPANQRLWPCAVIEIHGKKSLIVRLGQDHGTIEDMVTSLQSRFPEVAEKQCREIYQWLYQLYDIFPDGSWPIRTTKREPWVLMIDGIDSRSNRRIDVGAQMQQLKLLWPVVVKLKTATSIRRDGGSINRKDWIEAFNHEGAALAALSISHCTPLVRDYLNGEPIEPKSLWRFDQIDRWAQQLHVSHEQFLQGYQILYGLVSILQPTLIRLRTARVMKDIEQADQQSLAES